MCDPRCGVGVAQPCGWSGRGGGCLVAQPALSRKAGGLSAGGREDGLALGWSRGTNLPLRAGASGFLRRCRHPVWEALQVEGQQVQACQESGWGPGSWRPWRFPGSTHVLVWVGRA